MKFTYLTILILFLTCAFSTSAFGQTANNAKCPEIKESDIFLIHGFILQEAKMQKKSSLNVTSDIQNDEKKFESFIEQKGKAPNLFRDYWQKNGVNFVSDPKTCSRITHALKQQEMDFKDDYYRKVFFSVNDKFITFYVPQKIDNTFYKKSPSPIIMDDNYQIIK